MFETLVEQVKSSQALKGWIRSNVEYLGIKAELPADLRAAMIDTGIDSHALEFAIQLEATAPSRRAMGDATGLGAEHFDDSAISAFENSLLESDLRQYVTKHRTDGTGELLVPSSDDTANRGRIISDTTQHTKTDIPTSKATLEAYQHSSDNVLVHNSLLMAVADYDVFVLAALGRRLSRGQEYYAINGTGTAQPNGLTNTAPASGVSLASSTEITYDELVAIEHSVTHTMRRKAAWLMSDAVAEIAKKVTSTDGRVAFIPGTPDGRIPPTILGHPLVVAAQGADDELFFGDLSYVHYRETTETRIYRSLEAYAEYNQTEFIAVQGFDTVLDLKDASNPPVTKTAV